MNRVGCWGQPLYSLKYLIIEDKEKSLKTISEKHLMGVTCRCTHQSTLLGNKIKGYTRDAYCNQERNKNINEFTTVISDKYRYSKASQSCPFILVYLLDFI